MQHLYKTFFHISDNNDDIGLRRTNRPPCISTKTNNLYIVLFFLKHLKQLVFSKNALQYIDTKAAISNYDIIFFPLHKIKIKYACQLQSRIYVCEVINSRSRSV